MLKGQELEGVIDDAVLLVHLHCWWCNGISKHELVPLLQCCITIVHCYSEHCRQVVELQSTC